MPHRKRRFESLEDRRLLTALVGPALSSASNAAETAPATTPTSAASTMNDASPSDSTDSSGSGGDSTDNYSEYAPTGSSASAEQPSNSGGTASGTNSYSNSYSNAYYAAPGYDYSPSTEYATKYTDTPKTTSTTQPSTQPTTTVPALQPVALVSTNSSADAQALLPAVTPAGPSPAASPPAARSSSALVGSEIQPAVASAEPVVEQSNEGQQQIVAPVALSGPPNDWAGLTARTAALEELVARADELAPSPDLAAAKPIVGSLRVQFAALEQGIDDVFDRLEQLGDELVAGHGAMHIAEWLVIAGGACAAFEFARARYREGGSWQAPSPWLIPYEPKLRRRWFGRKDAG